MKKLIIEYTINKIFSKIEKNDSLIIIGKKQYNLKIVKVNPDSIIGELNNKLFLIKKDALQNKKLYFSKLENNTITGQGNIDGVIEVRIIRGYNTIEKISTKLPPLTKDKLNFLKEVYQDLKIELTKIKIGDEIIIETAFLKEPENEKDKDLIDENSITQINIDINGEPKDGYFKGIVTKVSGYEIKRYNILLNLEIIFNSNGFSFANQSDGTDKSGSYLKFKKIIDNEIIYVSDIVNIEIKTGAADSEDDNPNVINNDEKNYSDKEIFNIVSNDPVMSKILKNKPSFWDYILGKTHEQSIDDTMDTLNRIKNNLNKTNKKSSNINGKIYTIKFESDDISGNPKFKLMKNNKYTAKVLLSTNKKTILGIYLLNSINKDHNIYTIDIFDELKRGTNKGKVYYGGKTENKTRKFVGNGEINIL